MPLEHNVETWVVSVVHPVCEHPDCWAGAEDITVDGMDEAQSEQAVQAWARTSGWLIDSARDIAYCRLHRPDRREDVGPAREEQP